MANKYGFDIENPMSWYLYEKSQPNLRAGPDPWQQFKTQRTLESNQIAENMTNAGEWLMTLPFSMVPGRQSVVNETPSYNPSVFNSTWIDGTKMTYKNYPTWALNRTTTSKLTDLNEPTQDLSLWPEHFLPFIKPEAKLAVFNKVVTGTAKVASVVTPEAIKAKLPPAWRGLLHYLAGSGTPSTLNLTFDKLKALGTIGPGYSDGAAEGYDKLLEHPATQPYYRGPAAKEGSDSFDHGMVRLINPQPEVETALGKYYFDIPSQTFLDDYRFYNLTNHPVTPASQIAGIKDFILNQRTRPDLGMERQGTMFEAWLANMGKPFPVIIKPK